MAKKKEEPKKIELTEDQHEQFVNFIIENKPQLVNRFLVELTRKENSKKAEPKKED